MPRTNRRSGGTALSMTRGNPASIRSALSGVRRRAIADTLYITRAFRSALHAWFLLVSLLLAQITTALIIGYPLRRWVGTSLVRLAERDSRSAISHLPRQGDGEPSGYGDGEERAPAFLTAMRWALVNSAAGPASGCTTMILGVGAAVSFTCPLWWWLLPPEYAVNPGLYRVDSWLAAAVTPLVGLVYLALYLALVPRLALWHARLAHRTLTRGNHGLLARITQITASRDDALEVHRTELLRIERDLHDGTQNRLVAMRVHLGLLERMLAKDPERARDLLETTKEAADEALRELRDVVRSIYPPLLADRGLASAVSSLAARSPVPCSIEANGLGRAPAAVETAAYFVVAEALTNVHKHSDGSQASVLLTGNGRSVLVRVTDDGRGGANEHAGTGLAGLRRRVASLEGTLSISSPTSGPTTVEARFPCAY